MAIIHIINIIDKIIIVFFLIIPILNYSFHYASLRSSSSKNFFKIFVCQILSLRFAHRHLNFFQKFICQILGRFVHRHPKIFLKFSSAKSYHFVCSSPSEFFSKIHLSNLEVFRSSSCPKQNRPQWVVMSQTEPSPMGHLHSYQLSASETSAISGTFKSIALSICSFIIPLTSSVSSIGASIIISSCTCKTIFAFNFLSINSL